jgi:hypothetical protein
MRAALGWTRPSGILGENRCTINRGIAAVEDQQAGQGPLFYSLAGETILEVTLSDVVLSDGTIKGGCQHYERALIVLKYEP